MAQSFSSVGAPLTVPANKIRRENMKIATLIGYSHIAIDLLKRCTIRPLFCQYYVTEFTLPGADELSLQYIGDGGQYSYILGLVFGSNTEQLQKRTHSKLSFIDLLQRRLPTTDADLSVVDLDFPLQRWLSLPGIEMPHWLKQKISLGSDWDAYLTGMRRKTRREAQRMIRKFDLVTRLVSGEDYGSSFYQDLYQPYISARHGDSSVIIDKATFMAKIKHSQIMQLLFKDEVIAAAQIDSNGSTLTLGWTGVASREEKELRGAADALDYFCVKHAFDSGCVSVDMGHSRPVLSDGILRYKKKWNASVNTGVVPQGSLVFCANSLSTACRTFFERNSLLSKGSLGLEAHLLINDKLATDKTEMEKAVNDAYIDGLKKIIVYLPCGVGVPEQSVPCALEAREYNNEEQLLMLLAGRA